MNDRIASEWAIGLHRNGRSDCVGIDDRIGAESAIGLRRNTQNDTQITNSPPNWSGFCFILIEPADQPEPPESQLRELVRISPVVREMHYQHAWIQDPIPPAPPR